MLPLMPLVVRWRESEGIFESVLTLILGQLETNRGR